MSIFVTQPFPIFYDRAGTPLDAGYIYIGVAGVNPETAPITVYWDTSQTTTAAQPIRTLNGYPSRDGSPAMLINNQASYSIVVKDRNGTLVFSDLNASQDLPMPPKTVKGNILPASALPTNVTQTELRDLVGWRIVELEDYGGAGDGVTNNTIPFNNMLTALTGSPGRYILKLRGGSTVYRFNSKPNDITLPLIIWGESYSTTAITRNYSGGSDDEGFIVFSGAGSIGSGIEQVQVIAATGTTGGTMLKWVTGVNVVAGFVRCNQVVVTYNGTGTYHRAVLVDGSLNKTSGAQGYRDWNANNCYFFVGQGNTESCRFINATNATGQFWYTGTCTVTGDGTALGNTTNLNFNVTGVGAFFMSQSVRCSVFGVVDTLNFSTGTDKCSFHGTVQIVNGGVSDVGVDNYISTYQDWVTYTPVATPAAGALTSYTASGRYRKLGNVVHVAVQVVMTDNGTGSGSLAVTLPINSAAGLRFYLAGRETTGTGDMLYGEIGSSASAMDCRKYNNAYPVATGQTIFLSGTYEVA
jgi:hypothetical protein